MFLIVLCELCPWWNPVFIIWEENYRTKDNVKWPPMATLICYLCSRVNTPTKNLVNSIISRTFLSWSTWTMSSNITFFKQFGNILSVIFLTFVGIGVLLNPKILMKLARTTCSFLWKSCFWSAHQSKKSTGVYLEHSTMGSSDHWLNRTKLQGPCIIQIALPIIFFVTICIDSVWAILIAIEKSNIGAVLSILYFSYYSQWDSPYLHKVLNDAPILNSLRKMAYICS